MFVFMKGRTPRYLPYHVDGDDESDDVEDDDADDENYDYAIIRCTASLQIDITQAEPAQGHICHAMRGRFAAL